MKKIGLTHFRFSISWSRILPNGTKAGGVNKLGIDFYNDLINHLLANDIQPFVTLFNWDVPQALEHAYGGFLSNEIVPHFRDFAQICFSKFGDRVKNWITINEPNYYAILGYALGYQVPNRCTRWQGPPCVLGGDSATEPYVVGHNLLLSHAAAVNLYRQHYHASQEGKIGIAIQCPWLEPFDTNARNIDAKNRYYEHLCGWIFNPVTFGDYPKLLHSMVGDRLPKFTAHESKLLKKSYDFIGLNYYTASYVQEDNTTIPHFELDDHAQKIFHNIDGKVLGKPTSLEWVYDYPEGLENLTLYLKRNYDNPIIIVTANGYPTRDEKNKIYSKEFYLKDQPRIQYVKGHIDHLHRAIESGANVKGYMISSFLDGFEWEGGYVLKYGLVYVDRDDGLKRHLKNSAKWYRDFLHY
ncbi:hypothetical protein RND81_09G211600 [Saponaria officinalis]